MSLVVAKIHGGGLTLVGDTRITEFGRGTETANRQVYRNAHPKIAILRKDLAVGVAGDNPHLSMPQVRQMREMSAEEVVESLAKTDYASFVVAALAPRRLWQITRGRIEPRTDHGRAWVGEPQANLLFQETYVGFAASTERGVDFLMFAAMRELVAWEHVKTVGGYVTRVFATSDGFRFGADQCSVGPDVVNAVVTATRQGGYIRIDTPPEVASQGYDLLLIPGDSPTIGALGCLIPQAKTAWLFCDSTPWGGHTIATGTATGLIELASRSHGQTLLRVPTP